MKLSFLIPFYFKVINSKIDYSIILYQFLRKKTYFSFYFINKVFKHIKIYVKLVGFFIFRSITKKKLFSVVPYRKQETSYLLNRYSSNTKFQEQFYAAILRS